MQPGLIKISGRGGKQRFYNKRKLDEMIVSLEDTIYTRIDSFISRLNGIKWYVSCIIFPPIDWGMSGEMWVCSPIIIETDPERSRSFIGSIWLTDNNIFRQIESDIVGVQWVIWNMIVDKDLELITSTSTIGNMWYGVLDNLFTTIDERNGGIVWEIIENINFEEDEP